jgi:hypothetical protein
MRTGAFGQIPDPDAPETTQCTVCRGTAERLSSAWQGEGIAYHNYQCRTDRCPAAGTLIEHESSEQKQIGPLFGDRDLAVRLVKCDHPNVPADTVEGRP